MYAHVAMHRRAIKADVNTEIGARPGGIASLAVKADLAGKDQGFRRQLLIKVRTLFAF
jgi:hypothetical protein